MANNHNMAGGITKRLLVLEKRLKRITAQLKDDANDRTPKAGRNQSFDALLRRFDKVKLEIEQLKRRNKSSH